MSTGTLSLMGLYNYDNSILDGLIPNLPTPDKLPTDYPDLYITGVTITPTTVINNLLMECAELEILYTNPDFLKWAVTQWSDKQRGVWQSFYNTTCYRYNPIWNKDGVITRTESESRESDNTTTRDLSSNYTRNLTDQRTPNLTKTSERDLKSGNQRQVEHNGEQTDTGTVTETPQTQTSVTQEEQVSTFNSADYRNKNQITTNTNNTGTVQNSQNLSRSDNYNETIGDNGTDTGTITDKETGNDITSHTGTETNIDSGTVNDKGSETVTKTYEDKETGNIGITMTQQMITAEREVASFNIIDYIIDDFKKRFCILIY